MSESRVKIERLKQLIDTAEKIVFFTGAGISTDSGIPDFRSPGTGLWNKIKPIDYSDFVNSEAVRIESWRRKFKGSNEAKNPQPNIGHIGIARLARANKVEMVITQNVDNLHQQSGLESTRVVELHGNASFAKCLDCELRYEIAALKEEFHEHGKILPCKSCKGIIKTATISFGQAMPIEEMARAEQSTLNCDLFIVIGSSLVVYPANGFPELANRLAIPLVILNREPTPLDDIADLVINEGISPVMQEVSAGYT